MFLLYHSLHNIWFICLLVKLVHPASEGSQNNEISRKGKSVFPKKVPHHNRSPFSELHLPSWISMWKYPIKTNVHWSQSQTGLTIVPFYYCFNMLLAAYQGLKIKFLACNNTVFMFFCFVSFNISQVYACGIALYWCDVISFHCHQIMRSPMFICVFI